MQHFDSTNSESQTLLEAHNGYGDGQEVLSDERCAASGQPASLAVLVTFTQTEKALELGI